MRTHYLHLCVFACIACNGPVISGSTATKETEIQRETDIKQIGTVCLSCGKRYGSLPISRTVRHIAPFEWNSAELADRNETSIQEAAAVAKHFVQ